MVLIILMPVILLSCQTTEPENTCNVANPAEDLVWLKERINLILANDPAASRFQYVSMAEYRGNNVFIIGNCNPAIISVFPVFDCSGEHLGDVGQIPSDSLLNRQVIWKTQDSECTF